MTLDVYIKELPRCPKCSKGRLLPLSQMRDDWGNRDWVLPIGEWRCSHCEYKRERSQ